MLQQLNIDRPKSYAEVTIASGPIQAVIQELFRKAGVRTRSQLVRIAIENHSSDWLGD
jgi:hypothetical protein